MAANKLHFLRFLLQFHMLYVNTSTKQVGKGFGKESHTLFSPINPIYEKGNIMHEIAAKNDIILK